MSFPNGSSLRAAVLVMTFISAALAGLFAWRRSWAGVLALRYDTIDLGFLAVNSYLPDEVLVSYTSYTPSLVEWVRGLGIISFSAYWHSHLA